MKLAYGTFCSTYHELQQYLPLAVLKPFANSFIYSSFGIVVATVLTACGIETAVLDTINEQMDSVATVLTACGIETNKNCINLTMILVATVLTACGIETYQDGLHIEIQIVLVATVLTACGIETGERKTI